VSERTEIHIDSSRPAAEQKYGSKVCSHCGSRFSNDARFCPFDGLPLTPSVSAPPRDPLLGSVIDDRYEVEAVLGEGGMGTVYRVRHRILERLFALKALRLDLARDADLGERFLREARAVASISHPGVVQITDFGALPTGQTYFVMELLTGEPLSTLLGKGGPLPAARAVRLLLEMIEALSAAHAAGVVHRDLKPDNVLVCPTQSGETVKILDFGLAKVAGQSRLTQAGVVFGTPHYMSPEQASGGTVDERTDVYALGVVMYQMFTGRVPFEADSYMGVLTKHLYVAPTPPSELLGGLTELGALELVVLRCLEKKPERRYASMRALADEISRFAKFGADGTFTVEPAQPGERRAPRLADELELPSEVELRAITARGAGPRGRKPAVVAVLAMLLAAAIATTWVFLRSHFSTREPLRATPVASVHSTPTAPAYSAPLVTPVMVTPTREPAPPAASGMTGAEPYKDDRAHPVAKPAPHTNHAGLRSPSGSHNNTITQGKAQENGIVDPWSR
jgi:serine/threonine-protein kinase